MTANVIPASADGTSTTPLSSNEQATQTNMENLLSGLQGVVSQMQGSALTGGGLSSTGTDPSAMIASAEQQVSQMSASSLDQLASALNADPSWQQIPTQLSGAVTKFTQASAKVSQKNADFAGTFTDSCNSAGSAPDEFTATEVANEVQLAAQAAMLAAPGVAAVFTGVDVPTGVKIALAVVWGVADAVYLGLAQTLAVSTDCAATAFSNLQTAVAPTSDTAGTTTDTNHNPLRASSESSVLNLITSAGSMSTEITNVDNTVNAVNTQTNTLVTNTGDLNVTLSGGTTSSSFTPANTQYTGLSSQESEIRTDAQTLQTDVSVLNNTLSTDLVKSDQEINNLNTFQTLQLRMDIEENLQRNSIGSGPIALFELPAASGGYLDTVKSIVGDILTKETANKGPTSSAIVNGTADYNTANNDFAAGLYKTAYQYYTKAYHDVR